MILVGMFGRAGTGTVAEIDANVAATLGLLVTFGFLLMNFSTASELAKIFEEICGGIPFLSELADYGSLRSVMHEAPLKAAMAFFDVVFLSTIINLLSLLPLTSGSATGKFMVKIFTGMVLALVSLMILNFVVKESETYRYLTACLGALIAITSLGSIPIFIISIIKANSYSGMGFIGMLFYFLKEDL